MAWHYTTAPDQVQPELGPDLLDGDYSTANPSWAHTAGTYSVTGGGRLALTVGDPHLYLALTPDAVYTITVEVRGADTVSWDMTLQNPDGDQVVLPVGDVDATPTGDWVTVIAEWRAPVDPLTGSPALTATGPGLVEVRNPVMAAQTGRVILTVPGDVLAENIMASGGLIAGDPAGAHLELKGTGLHAYDATGTETAHISGAEGVFVGGEFRTSDNLPGQVTLSDDAYVTHLDGGGTFPGVKVVPIDTTDMQLPAAIGPSVNGLTIFGGRNTAGGSSIVQANPTASFMRTFSGGTAAGEIQTSPTASYMRTFHAGGATAGEIQTSPTASYMRTYREDGGSAGEIQTSPTASLMRTYREDGTKGGEIQTSPTRSMMRTYSGNSLESGWMRAQPQDAELAYVDSGNTYFSRIKADASEAFLYTRAGGTTRVLSVDANGVWVKTGSKSYNLEETAQDSGWVNIPFNSGFQGSTGGAPFQYRRAGNLFHLRGRIQRTSGTFVYNTSYEIGSIPSSDAPSYNQRTIVGAGPATSWCRVDVGASGVISLAYTAASPASGGTEPTWIELAGTYWTID